MSDDERSLAAGGSGAVAYAETISVYLAFCVDKMTDYEHISCSWQNNPDRLTQATFPSGNSDDWDYAEANVFGQMLAVTLL